MQYTYVYILRSLKSPTRHYTGITTNLKTRLTSHNAGQITSTKANRPWELQTAIAFNNKSRATRFETYLKSHSGRVFASRHF